MSWTQFQPMDSLLRAEGNGMTIDSTKVPAVGTVLEFNRAGRSTYTMTRAELYVPDTMADMLGFGIITPWYTLTYQSDGTPVYTSSLDDKFLVGTNDECIQTMLAICGEGAATDKLKSNLQRGNWTPGFSDIIPMAAPMMYKKGTGVTRVPKPAHYALGPTKYVEAFRVFRYRLQDYVGDRHIGPQLSSNSQEEKQLHWIIDSYDELRLTGYWDGNHSMSPTNGDDDSILGLISDKLVQAETWLSETFLDTRADFAVVYKDLLRCHIECAVRYKDGADSMIKDGTKVHIPSGCNDYGDARWIIRGMHKYCDYILNGDNPAYIYQLMKGRGYTGEHSLLVAAWFTMMFRAFCWQRIHYMVSGARVGSQYWNSILRIYIT
jgi:hypothetical protein